MDVLSFNFVQYSLISPQQQRNYQLEKKCDTDVPTHVVALTQVGTSVYLGQTHLGTPLQVPAWVRKFSLESAGDEISSLIFFQGLICTAEV